MRTTLTPVAIAIALALSACGETEVPQPAAGSSAGEQALQERVEKLESDASRREAEAARKLEAAQKKIRAARRKARAAKREAQRRRAEAREAEQAEATPVAATDGDGGIVVPDVTGMDHQAAQDVMQGEGLWLLDEVDCTGQDRMLLWDRNWEVVRTDPPAGSRVREDDTITLCSKKQGE